MAARVYVVLNRKGGSTKTTLCFLGGSELARRGNRLLLLDLDPQCNLTDKLLMDPATGEIPIVPYERSIAAIFDEELYVEDKHEIITPTTVPGVMIIPGHTRVEYLNRGDPGFDDRQLALRDFLAEIQDKYDYVFCDCPPNLMLGSWSALVAGDAVITPLIPEDFGAMGLKLLNESIARVRREANPALALLGYVLVMCEAKSPLHSAYAKMIRDSYPGQVLDTEVPVSRDIKMSVMCGKPITAFKPRSKASQVIRALCDELLARDAPMPVDTASRPILTAARECSIQDGDR